MTMKRFVVIAVIVLVVASSGDSAMARGRRRGSYGRRGGGGFGGTVASAAAMGYAQVLRAQGQANLANSRAAINWEQAKTLEIQNRRLWTETYFKMREINHAARLLEEGPRITEDQAVALAKAAAPRALDARELDPTTGSIAYPEVLQDPAYSSLRHDIDLFFATLARTGSAGFNERQDVRTAINLLHGELMRHIDQYDAGAYGHAVSFLESLEAASHGTL
jgi:hypothetical protein